TWWAHRPMAPVGLPFGYIQDFNGEFAPWNETQWVDEEFTAVLRAAEGELDLDARRELVAELETIQRDRGSVCIPFFTNVWQIYASNVKNVPVSPEEYTMFTETWIEA
ncbi:MAG TPA: hypothetical protein VJ965_04905, partial [Anaerolineales bacterium]|nr:hypothetical protein [Anaerolineales bacterium]